jgi:hypothetical protein
MSIVMICFQNKIKLNQIIKTLFLIEFYEKLIFKHFGQE